MEKVLTSRRKINEFELAVGNLRNPDIQSCFFVQSATKKNQGVLEMQHGDCRLFWGKVHLEYVVNVSFL